MTLANSRRQQQTNGTVPEAAAAAAAVPDEQPESTLTAEERLAQLKEQVRSNEQFQKSK